MTRDEFRKFYPDIESSCRCPRKIIYQDEHTITYEEIHGEKCSVFFLMEEIKNDRN